MKTKFKLFAFPIGLIIIGIMSIIFSFICFSDESIYVSFSYAIHETYGGDAYTGIQNAAADTAQNIIDLGEIIEYGILTLRTCFGFILLIIGLLILLYGIQKFLQIKKETKPTEQPSIAQDNNTEIN